MQGDELQEQNILVVLAGLPASGKSTLANRLGQLLQEKFGITTILIASDTVRSEIPALKQEFLPELEPAVRKMTLDRVKSALEQGLSVILDDLNYFRSMRFELVTLARELEVPHALVLLDTPPDVCLRLNAARGRKIPDEVILKDADRFDAPGQDPWDEPLASINTVEFDWEELHALANDLRENARNFVPWTPPVRNVHTPRRIEELDLLARRIVGELYRESSAEADGKRISRLRQELVRRAEMERMSDNEADELFRQSLGALFE